jgi:hypothetical protein
MLVLLCTLLDVLFVFVLLIANKHNPIINVGGSPKKLYHLELCLL